MTLWDAPGMQRIKIPFGRLTADQLDRLADLAEEYSDRILHVTTRQDIQLHFVHIEDTPDLMRRLGAVGITTREACGNTVRNVTACPFAGVCQTEAFDVAPYAHAMTFFLLGHDDTQNFGRKFKVAFSGCKDNPCGLANFHDIGAIARTRVVDGKTRRGFELYVGGGLGAVPQNAQLFDEFLPEEELLPIAQAMSRVFARLGEKANRAKARMKFLIKKLGLEEFKRLVLEERATLRPDPRWTAYLADLHVVDETPVRPAAPLASVGLAPGFQAWRTTNVVPQRQPGYVMTLVTLPLGDLTSDQARALADVARKFTGDAIRTTADQNLLLRWVSEADLPAVHAALAAIDLARPGAGTITDITACPGTDTCKLGISSSRALAAELGRQLEASGVGDDPNAGGLHIKASGCFNACGQHHVADIGFLGVSRNVNGRRVPHFQLVVGGQWTHNAGSYGLAIGAVPSKRVPEIVKRLTSRFAAERQGDETFAAFVNRIGKKTIRAMVEELQVVPSHDQDPSFYSDWGRSARVHHRRHGRRRVRGRGRPHRRGRAGRGRARDLRGPGAHRRGEAEGGGGPRLQRDAGGGAVPDPREEPEPRHRARRDRGGVPQALLRHPAVLRSVRGGQVRPVSVPHPRGARRRREPGGGPPAGRGGDAVRRRRPPVLRAPRRFARRAGAGDRPVRGRRCCRTRDRHRRLTDPREDSTTDASLQAPAQDLRRAGPIPSRSKRSFPSSTDGSRTTSSPSSPSTWPTTLTSPRVRASS